MGVADTELVELLELLHPDGPGSAGVLVVDAGRGARGALAAAESRALVAVRGAAPVRAWVGRRLRSAGFRGHGPFLVRPRRGGARLLVPAGGGPARYAATRLGPKPGLARAALRSRWAGRAATLAASRIEVVADSSSSGALDWLSFAGRPPRLDEVLAFRGGSGGGDRRLLVFEAPGDTPVASVRVRETGSTRTAAPASAAAAGAEVPRLLGRETFGRYEVAVETAVPGTPAVSVLAGRRRALVPTLELVAGWLERWNLSTARPSDELSEVLERELLGPARELGPSYRDAVAPLAERLAPSGVRVVAAHGDLTMWNVLVELDRRRLGVIDWETTRDDALPLGDLLYAAVDALAAVDSYRDRLDAFKRCFTEAGDAADAVDALVRRHVHALDLRPELVVVAFHACWLGHARNEAARGAAGDRPFERIADWLLAESGSLREWARP